MQFRLTQLEREILTLPEGERAARLGAFWTEFRQSKFFDFVVYVLRDLEGQALDRIRTRPTAVDLSYNAMVLNVVDRIRRTFAALATGPEPVTVADWSDDEAFLTEDEGKEYGPSTQTDI